jgi:hypothetical protein
MPIFAPDSLQFFVLDDGEIWSVEHSAFVDSPTAAELANNYPRETWSKAPGPDGRCDEAGLHDALVFYSLPLGVLATDEDLAKDARAKRNALIAETDYMVMPDYPLDEERKAAILAYRQALRDVPEQAGFPRQIDWPAKP